MNELVGVTPQGWPAEVLAAYEAGYAVWFDEAAQRWTSDAPAPERAPEAAQDRCPRCRGRMFSELDESYCVACGHRPPPENASDLARELEVAEGMLRRSTGARHLGARI